MDNFALIEFLGGFFVGGIFAFILAGLMCEASKREVEIHTRSREGDEHEDLTK